MAEHEALEQKKKKKTGTSLRWEQGTPPHLQCEGCQYSDLRALSVGSSGLTVSIMFEEAKGKEHLKGSHERAKDTQDYGTGWNVVLNQGLKCWAVWHSTTWLACTDQCYE